MLLPDFFPARHWMANITPSSIRSDAFAGFTNAAIVLPQGVAFSTIAGLPPEYGLFTAMITAVIAAIFGSSMIMVSGPTTAISAVLFATLSDLEPAGTDRYIQLALLLTILVGIFQLAGGFARLGGLISLVSHSVITAFTAAAALLIAVSQLAGALGVHVERGGNVVERIVNLGGHIVEINWMAMTIGIFTLIIAILTRKFFPKIPAFLVALLAGSVLAWQLDASNHGVSMIGALPPIIPTLVVPQVSVEDMALLSPGAAAIALVGLLEAISIGRSFAVRRKEHFDPNQEMVGQGLSNAVGGFFQCYAGSGSFTRSGVNASAGAKTPLSAVFASLFLGFILLFVSPLVAYIPTPAMSGLILFVAWNLVDVKEIAHIINSKSAETLIFALTLLTGLLVELDAAIYVGVIASLSVFVYESSHPELTVTAPLITASGSRKFRDVTLHGLKQCPQMITMSLDGPLYFGSVEHVEQAIKKIRKQNTKQKHIILYLKGVGKIDLAGADLLINLIRDVKENDGSFRIVASFPPLISGLHRFHVIDELGEDHLHSSKGEAVAAAAETDLSARICKICLLDVYSECDTLRES